MKTQKNLKRKSFIKLTIEDTKHVAGGYDRPASPCTEPPFTDG